MKKLYWILSSQFGIDIRKFFYSLLGVVKYINQYIKYRVKNKGIMEVKPCLHDWFDINGSTDNEYFWQDLFVANLIHKNSPKNHIDVGSRVDGFIAHVATFMKITVLDIRENPLLIPNVEYKVSDVMNEYQVSEYCCDSLSSLHALEHFGLGRYGDDLNVDGSILGLKNMSLMLNAGGIFYLSIPLGIERVEFNANRIFNPETIINLARDNGLILKDVYKVDKIKGVERVENRDFFIKECLNVKYILGIFIFIKKSC
jgi:hypothetical protein